MCQVIELPRDHPQRAKWKDLRTLAAITCCRTLGGKETWETRLSVSSHGPCAKPLAHAMRQHWGVENSLHNYA